MLLIDGYNLLFCRRRLGRDELPKAREGLILSLARYCELTGLRAIAVFDFTKGPPVFGIESRRRVGEVEVRYTPKGVTADDEIMGMVADTRDRTAYTVVTNDRTIADAARRRHVEVIESTQFLEALDRLLEEARGRTGEAPEKSKGLKPGEADYWMKEFGFTDE